MAWWICFQIFIAYVVLLQFSLAETESSGSTFKIEGKVSVSGSKNKAIDWLSETVVHVNGGEYKGFLKADGSFVVNSVPSGSHVVEVVCPNYEFPKYRVDITKAGKIRARHINYLQPNSVQVVPYPLRFVSSGQAAFFEVRETWKMTDFLFNPMVLMMIVPIIFMFIMPKMMSMADPEAQKEMQDQMGVFNQQKQLPEFAEIMSSLFGGGAAPKKKKAALGDRGAPARKAAGGRKK